MDNVLCEYCGNFYSKYGIRNHVDILHLKIRKANKGAIKNKNKIPWNKGKTKNDDHRVLIYSEKISNKLKGKPTHKQTEKTKQKLRESAKKNNLGGHTSKFKLFFEKNDGNIVYLQSSYEIQVAKELEINNIKWVRPTPLNWIDDKNENHKYYPDFYLIDYDIYLDPKNYYLQKKDAQKIKLVEEQNNIKIFILSENELTWNKIKRKALLI
jgi:hypothetical protein